MRYVLTEDHIRDGERILVSYGIAVVAAEENNLTVIDHVSGISTDPEPLRVLTQKCNDYGLDRIHLRDTIADFLA